MKLVEIMSQEAMEREHVLGLVEDHLLSDDLDPRLRSALDKLDDIQFEKVKGILYNIALDNYDYATDTGASVYVPDEAIVNALKQVGVM